MWSSAALTERHRELYEEFRTFAEEEVAPIAARHDGEQGIDQSLVRTLAERGYLASLLPAAAGGRGIDHVAYGFLHETIGTCCTSTRTLITVHDMVVHCIWRWGGEALKKRWLPMLAEGDAVAAFALSEPGSSSSTSGVAVTAEATASGGYVLHGHKKWISFGQIADVFLVAARAGHGIATFLVPADTSGLRVIPIRGLLGARGSMAAEVVLDGCVVPDSQRVGRLGREISSVITSALTLGRLGVAAGSTGLLQGCLDTAQPYVADRRDADGPLIDHQLVQRLLADMVVDVEAARLLWLSTAVLLDCGDPHSAMSAMIAKHFAAQAAARGSRSAVQLLGAAGCTTDHPVERLFRDAKVMEIIEGGNEVQQATIGRFGHTDPTALFPSGRGG